MTALPANVVPYQPPAASLGPLLPQTISEAMQLARLMSEAKVVPQHLRGAPADCFLVINQARLWRMDPFAVAQGTSFIHGRMMYEGKLVAGVVHSLGNLTGRLNYEYAGSGDDRSITVSGTLRGEDKPRTVTVKLKDVKTTNGMWTKQPDQQLAYSGARVWARRHVPEVLLGVYTPEEFDAPQMRDVTPAAPQIEQPAEAKPPPPVKPPLLVSLPDGWEPAQFPRTGKGLREALEFLTGAVVDGAPQVVGMNVDLLDTIAEKMPALADEVANLRAAAAEAMATTDDAELADDATDDPDDFPGDFPSGTASSLPPSH
jgi:RecT family